MLLAWVPKMWPYPEIQPTILEAKTSVERREGYEKHNAIGIRELEGRPDLGARVGRLEAGDHASLEGYQPWLRVTRKSSRSLTPCF